MEPDVTALQAALDATLTEVFPDVTSIVDSYGVPSWRVQLDTEGEHAAHVRITNDQLKYGALYDDENYWFHTVWYNNVDDLIDGLIELGAKPRTEKVESCSM